MEISLPTPQSIATQAVEQYKNSIATANDRDQLQWLLVKVNADFQKGNLSLEEHAELSALIWQEYEKIAVAVRHIYWCKVNDITIKTIN